MKEKTSERSIWKAISFLKRATEAGPKSFAECTKCFLGIWKTDIDRCVHTPISTAYPSSGCTYTHTHVHTHIYAHAQENTVLSTQGRSLTETPRIGAEGPSCMLATMLPVGPDQFHLPQCQRALLGEKSV